MTFKQWLKHLRQWWFMVCSFPLPKNDTHMWTGIVGERDQDCIVCGAKGIDRDISDAEIERDREMSAEYDNLHEKYFGKDNE